MRWIDEPFSVRLVRMLWAETILENAERISLSEHLWKFSACSGPSVHGSECSDVELVFAGAVVTGEV